MVMPELNIVDRKNKKVGTVEASQSVFEVQCREELVQRYVTMQLATRRGGNAATKQNKGELHGPCPSGKHSIADLAGRYDGFWAQPEKLCVRAF